MGLEVWVQQMFLDERKIAVFLCSFGVLYLKHKALKHKA